MTSTRRFLLTAVAAALLATTTAGNATRVQTVPERFRAMFEQKAAEFGVDLETLLNAPATISVHGDGEVREYVRPFGEVLRNLYPDTAASSAMAQGPLGTPEYAAGNITHLFATLWAGATSEAVANCQSVSVRRSQTVPDTYALASQAGGAAGVPVPPIVPVTGAPLFLTPVPGLLSPVIPPASWILPAYAWLGPTMHITARYTLGLHQVGTLIGSTVSTAQPAAAPYPVWLPMVSGASFAEDRSIDFVGQGLFFSASARLDAFGYTLCGGAGALALSNGAAIFDNHPVLGISAGLPDIP
ncbi:MAG TPA: hypothetical protein VM841_00680 [Actinomycetota bacterium]|nr:hypothetical protein [Actinomycetota bacterium]